MRYGFTDVSEIEAEVETQSPFVKVKTTHRQRMASKSKKTKSVPPPVGGGSLGTSVGAKISRHLTFNTGSKDKKGKSASIKSDGWIGSDKR